MKGVVPKISNDYTAGTKISMGDAEDAIYTVPEVADILKVHRDTVQTWIENGELGHVKIGHRTTRILQSDINDFIRRKRAETVSVIS